MIANKNISKIIVVIMAAAVVFCFLAMGFKENLETALSGKYIAMEYESELFDTKEPIQIDIKIDENSWDEMLKNAMSEKYYTCDAVINGQTFYSVAIRPKGNTSLSSIAADETTDRFSLKLEFDHYVEGQLCYGLDKLILNNNYADATNMKEAIVYDMYQYLDADASLYNYAKISVNGDYWGIYLALEAVEDSFVLRNYGTADGKLYKPDNMDMGGNPRDTDFRPSGQPQEPEDFNPSNQPQEPEDFNPSNQPQEPEDFNPSNQPQESEDFRPSNQPGEPADFESSQFKRRMPTDNTLKSPDLNGKKPDGGMSMGGNGANLNYSDDDLDSYSAIWDGEVMKTDKTDHRRVVTALKNISQGKDLEKYLDIENLLKYMAVHTFSVNLDSLSGTMAHNYYLYECGGQLNILPWDYNLSFGGMSMGGASGASEVINDAIDTPFQGTEFFDSLLENDTYLKKYHEYLRQLTDTYVLGGKFDTTYRRIRSQIDGLVKNDPTAFYSYDEYDAGAKMLCQTITLRAESIRGQLSGDIPSTDEGQKQNASSLVDASEIDIDIMGVFQGGNKTAHFDGTNDRLPDQIEKNEKYNEGYDRKYDIISYAVSFLILCSACIAVKKYRRKPLKETG